MRRIKIKLSTVFTFCLAAALGATLFWVSQQVQALEREQYNLKEQVSSEQEGLRVLNAEWDYLNRPDRIEALASKYLNQMQPVLPDDLLKNAKAVPEPQFLRDEDGTPIMVSTSPEADEKKAGSANASPDARPIRDAEDSQTSNFDHVLKKSTGEDE